MKPRVTAFEFRVLCEIDRYIRRYNIQDPKGLRDAASDVLDGWVSTWQVQRFIDRRWLKPFDGSWDLTERALRRFWPERCGFPSGSTGIE